MYQKILNTTTEANVKYLLKNCSIEFKLSLVFVKLSYGITNFKRI